MLPVLKPSSNTSLTACSQSKKIDASDVLSATETEATLPKSKGPLKRSAAPAAPIVDALEHENSKSNRSPPLLSIIMTTRNTKAFLDKAVESIKAQTLSDWELLAVDDASSDGTFDTLVHYANIDKRIRPFHSLGSYGTYMAKNLGLTQAAGEFVSFQDSDDWSLPERMAEQVELLQKHPHAVACTCEYEHRNDAGELLLNRGLRSRKGSMTLVLRRSQVMEKLGFFDSVRMSADEEFRQRLMLVFGRDAIVHVPKPLYQHRARQGSLTSSGPAPLNYSAPEGKQFLSPLRQRYLDAYRTWHKAISSGSVLPYMSFPVIQRPFSVPDEFLP